MQRQQLPVNIQLMDTGPHNMNRLPPITVLDTFDGTGDGQNFHPNGLFSIEYFGRPGSADRMVRFGRIDLKVTILHPFIYKKICKLKGLYKEILHGKAYAIFDVKEKDFVRSTIMDGQTGFAFFMEYLPKIEFKLTDSKSRALNVKLVKNAIESGRAFVKTVPVIPAGIRDVFIEADGRITEDEINSKYRSLIASTNALPETGDFNDPIYNTTRTSMQNALNAIFEYLWTMYEGKRGFAYKQYYSRQIENGTRNVLTSMDTRKEELGAAKGPSSINTAIGLFQVLKMLLPVATYKIRNGWLGQVFSAGDRKAYLVNPKTLKMELVSVNRKTFDEFNTPDGINKIINKYFNRKIRHKPVMIDGYYAGLVYRGVVNGKKVFKFFNDIDDLPSGFNKDDVHPISWVELLYIAGYRDWNNYPVVFTRYPVAGLGSTIPNFIYTMTTTTGEERWELDDNWTIKKFYDGNKIESALEYPIATISDFMETAAIAPGFLAGLSADFDGDTGSQNAFYTKEAIEQTRQFLNSPEAYKFSKGGLSASPFVDTVNRTIHGLMSV